MKTRTLKALGLAGATAVLFTAVSLRAATLTLDFDAPIDGTLQDNAGKGTGFTTRLPGTGSLLPPYDYDLNLWDSGGALEMFTQQSDFNNQVNMDLTSAPGINLSTLGFTGPEDFSVTAAFRSPFVAPNFIDQLGVYVGKDSATLTRAGFITFANPEYFATHTTGGVDNSGRFYGFGLDLSEGMTVTISRTGGFWDYVVNGVHWLPNTAADGTGSYVPASFLDTETDLTVGVFAITPFNSYFGIYQLESFSVTVVPEPSSLALVALAAPAGLSLLRRRRSK